MRWMHLTKDPAGLHGEPLARLINEDGVIGSVYRVDGDLYRFTIPDGESRWLFADIVGLGKAVIELARWSQL